MYNKFPHLLNNIYQTGWFLCPISKYIGRGISHCLIAVTYAGIWRSIRQQFLACVFREPQPWEIGTQKPKLNRCRCRKLKIYIHYFCGPSLGSEFPFIYDCLCPQMFFLFSYIFFNVFRSLACEFSLYQQFVMPTGPSFLFVCLSGDLILCPLNISSRRYAHKCHKYHICISEIPPTKIVIYFFFLFCRCCAP